MSKIGYAVFGSPKGIAVQSNGLFRQLNLDKSLYLNSSHIVLENGHYTLMLRRIPSNLNNLEKKDALLLVLYGQALQFGENRPGGFVGSAICFSEKFPSAKKMIEGLFYLFSQMKTNVDDKNRFKAIDSSNWNINLPDPNREFGMFESGNLAYLPLTNSRRNVVVKLNNLEKDSIALLSNFLLNGLFHDVDYLYASDSDEVVGKLVKNNFKPIEFNSLFNYSEFLERYRKKINDDREQLSILRKQSNTILDQIKTSNKNLQDLINNIQDKKRKINQIDEEIAKLKLNLVSVKEELKEEKRSLDEVRRLGNPAKRNGNTNANPIDKEKTELKNLFNRFSNIIMEGKGFDANSNRDSKTVLTNYFEKLPLIKSKAKKRQHVILGLLLVIMFTFLGLFLFEKGKLATKTSELLEITKLNQDLNSSIKNIETANKSREQLLQNIHNYKKNSSKSNYLVFKKHAKLLLDNFLADKYKSDSPEIDFINEYSWGFWEFDYKNKELVEKLKLDGNNYFIELKGEIKEIKKTTKWLGDQKIELHLENYLKEPNDIYQNIQLELKTEDILEHFKWVIEKANNQELENIKKNDKIGFPYLK